MFKYIPELNGKSEMATCKVLEEYFQQPAPRKISREIKRLIPVSPIAHVGALLAIIMGIMVAISPFMTVRSGSKEVIFAILCGLCALGVITFLMGYLFRGACSYRLYESGIWGRAKIISLKLLPMRHNSNSCYLMKLSITAEGGKEITRSCFFSTLIAPQFFKVFDSTTEEGSYLDVIYLPNSRGVIVPLKIILIAKYDQS